MNLLIQQVVGKSIQFGIESIPAPDERDCFLRWKVERTATRDVLRDVERHLPMKPPPEEDHARVEAFSDSNRYEVLG